MKVQRKHGAVETYEVLEESTNYYIIKGSATFVHVVSKADYEPVQEWMDVTQYCRITLVDSARHEYAICYASDLVESPFKKDVYKVTHNDKTGGIKVERKKA